MKDERDSSSPGNPGCGRDESGAVYIQQVSLRGADKFFQRVDEIRQSDGVLQELDWRLLFDCILSTNQAMRAIPLPPNQILQRTVTRTCHGRLPSAFGERREHIE
jgi:hypothetical protein